MTSPAKDGTTHERRHPIRWLRWPAGVVVVVALSLIALQISATPLARMYTHKALKNLHGYEGRVGTVEASVFPPRYSLSDLVLVEEPGGSWRDPLLSIQRVDLRLDWHKLFKAAVVADVFIEHPRIDIVQHAREERQGKGKIEEKTKRLPDLEKALENEAPLKVAHLDIHRGEVVVVDGTRNPPPRLVLSDVDLSANNLATRAALAENRPTTLVARGVLQKSGLVRASISADPWEKQLNFHGQVTLHHLQVTDLGNLLQSTAEMRPAQGTADLFADFRAKDGHLNGGVKPVLHDVKMAPVKSSVWDHLKTWLADVALDIFSRHKDNGEKKVATVIPIKGNITDPKAQLWPTVFGVVRNAFVQGLTEGFKDVPPRTAKKEQGPLKQAESAVSKGSGPPKAQPDKKQDEDRQARRGKH